MLVPVNIFKGKVLFYISEYGEIGRHDGLKIRWGKTRTGSSPVTPTIKPYSEGKPNAGEEINSHTML